MNYVCTFRMEGRDLERKKSSVRTGKIIRKTYFAIYNRTNFQGIYLFTQFGKLFEKNGPEIFTGGNLFNIIIGELMFLFCFLGGMEDCSVDSGSCADNMFLFSSPIS